jgi:hypothetical protein
MALLMIDEFHLSPDFACLEETLANLGGGVFLAVQTA